MLRRMFLLLLLMMMMLSLSMFSKLHKTKQTEEKNQKCITENVLWPLLTVGCIIVTVNMCSSGA